MSRVARTPCKTQCNSPAEWLNAHCYCTTLNREKLNRALDGSCQDILTSHPQLFSSTSVFISPAHFTQISNIIESISRVTSLPSYRTQAMTQAPAIANFDPGAQGAFMGYDFHLGANGPQIIEINTNAGGAFLNASLHSAQIERCRLAELKFPKPDLNGEFIEMFLNEWKLERGTKELKTIAIVDQNPQSQFLYHEFKLAQHFFNLHGFNAVIVDSNELKFSDKKLSYKNQIIDIVYNRLTDFYFSNPESSALRQAYERGAVVVTPNPRHHALYANKRNLVALSNGRMLENFGASSVDIMTLQKGTPVTRIVSEESAEHLWQTRRQYFFKPASGFGSRAAYRGDKLTKRVWGEILQGDYIAQEIVHPSERGVLVDTTETDLKVDIRAYVYTGEIQLLAARLYQGQTTNFRTRGGGFAPAFIAKQR